MRSNGRILLALIFSLAWLGLGSCTLPAPQAPSAPAQDELLPTVVAQTIQAVVPSPTLTAEPSTEPATATPTDDPEPTLSPTDEPFLLEPIEDNQPPAIIDPVSPAPTPQQASAAIQILSPGPASKVISPIRINAYLTPGDNGIIHIELLGEDGRLLARKMQSYITTTRLQMISELEFEISAAGELGRLTISTADKEGRAVAVASVDLLLLSLGEADITPSADRLDRIIIQEPAPRTLVQGGDLRVSGFIRPSGERFIWVELITADKRVVGYRLINIEEPQETGHTPFSVDIPYTVSEATWVRLTVYQKDGRIPGVINLSSRELLLSP
jgi:hypothetical protein